MSQWQFVSDDLSTGHIHILELHIYFFYLVVLKIETELYAH